MLRRREEKSRLGVSGPMSNHVGRESGRYAVLSKSKRDGFIMTSKHTRGEGNQTTFSYHEKRDKFPPRSDRVHEIEECNRRTQVLNIPIIP